MSSSAVTAPSAPLAAAIDEFGSPRGYLAVASIGLPPRASVAAMRADLDAWAAADRDPQGYDPVIARTRESYARLVGVDAGRVAIGSQTSVQAALIAAAAPSGAEIICVDGDFSSIIFPFENRRDLRLRAVPLVGLADAIGPETWLVVFSLVQSATGQVADAGAVLEAAHRHGALTLCDVTQAAGVLPVDAGRFDFTVCHTYKWLCSPRGVSFLTISSSAEELLTPLQAGWYAASTSHPPGRPGSGPSTRSRCSPVSTSPRCGSAPRAWATRSATPSASLSSTRRSSPGRIRRDSTCAP